MQKLVTLYLDNQSYWEGNFLLSSTAKSHGRIEEHLQDYLIDGWKIVSLSCVGGAGDAAARGWVVVVLEKGV